MTAHDHAGTVDVLDIGAYAFAKVEFPARMPCSGFYIGTLMVPATVTVIPFYLMMAETGLRNSFWALVLPLMFGSPYAIFLLREYFRTIPADLLNAARLDGANTLDVIVHVVIPRANRSSLTLTLITVVGPMEFVHVADGDHQWPQVAGAHRGDGGPANAIQRRWTLIMAATTVAIVPLLALFLVFQRHIVRSIVVTGLK